MYRGVYLLFSYHFYRPETLFSIANALYTRTRSNRLFMDRAFEKYGCRKGKGKCGKDNKQANSKIVEMETNFAD